MAALPILVVLAIWFAAASPADANRIYTHIYIHGVPVGGMNKDEAVAALMARFQQGLESKKVRYAINGQPAIEFTFADFGARFDFGGLVDSALEYSNLRSLPIRAARLLGRMHEITSPPEFSFNPERMEDIMAKLSAGLDSPPVNAAFIEEGGQLIVKGEINGHGVDIESAARATQAILRSLESGTVELQIITVEPLYTKEDFDFPKTVLGYFETESIDRDDSPRIRNIRIAAGRIHNQMLYPGEVFSAGAAIAAHLPDSGYEVSIVLVNGEPIEDVGGGVCQVVTTLYNAVLRAELEVLQRHNHSARVSYVGLGFDATVAGDYFDLKFKNNTPRPILITSHLRDSRLYVGIYGYETRKAGRSLRFEARQVELIQPEPYRQVVDSTIPRGEQFVTLESQMGYRIELFKLVYIDDTLVEEVKINTSVYKPLQGVIAIGAG